MEAGKELNEPVNENRPHSWVDVSLAIHVADVWEKTATEFWGSHPRVDLVGIDQVGIFTRPSLSYRCSILVVDNERDKGIWTLAHFHFVDSSRQSL